MGRRSENCGRGSALALALVMGICSGSIAHADAGHKTVQRAIQQVLSGARTSGKAFRVAVKASKKMLQRYLKDPDVLLPKALHVLSKRQNTREGRAFFVGARRCRTFRPTAGQDVETFAASVGKCFQRAADRSLRRVSLATLKRVVTRVLLDIGRGGKAMVGAFDRATRQLPENISGATLFPRALRAVVGKLSTLKARVFAQAGKRCATLRPKRRQDLDTFVDKVGSCLVVAAGGTSGASVDTIINQALSILIAGAKQGPSALAGALAAATAKLGPKVPADQLFTAELHTALKERANKATAQTLVRGATTCRNMVRGINQTAVDFTQKVGKCLADVAKLTAPAERARLVQKAVQTLLNAAREGMPKLKKAVAEADKILQSAVISTIRILPAAVRQAISGGNGGWLKQFLQLAIPCGTRVFKPHYDFTEYSVRMGLCLEAAAKGMTPQKVEQLARQAVRLVVAAAQNGSRALRQALDKQVFALKRTMRVEDLFPKDWSETISNLSDASAKALAVNARGCASTKAVAGQRLGTLMGAIAGCLRGALAKSGSGNLERVVREAVRALLGFARGGARSLRSGMTRAGTILHGLVSTDSLFTPALRRTIQSVDDAQAKMMAAKGAACADLPRAPGASVESFVESAARCLVKAATGAEDDSRQATLRGGLGELVSLSSAGPDRLKSRVTYLASKLRLLFKNPTEFANLLKPLDFAARTTAFSGSVRSDCLPLPAGSPSEVGAVAKCIRDAAKSAASIQPPDKCRGQEGSALLECCLQGSNRRLTSCAAHRFSCRPGYKFQNGSCLKVSCQPGFQAGPTGTCVRKSCSPGFVMQNGACVQSCPPGTTRGATGVCAATCPPGSARDSLGRCIQGSMATAPCTFGMVRNSQGLCVPACPMGMEHNAQGVCVMACPAGANRNAMGQCVSCPVGQTLSAMGMCVVQTCPFGTVRNAQGMCEVPCPPGTTRDLVTQQCTRSCPFGTVARGNACEAPCAFGTTRDALGLCVRACAAGSRDNGAGVCIRLTCQPNTTLDPQGKCVWQTCPIGFRRNPDGTCGGGGGCPAGQIRRRIGFMKVCMAARCPAGTSLDNVKGACVKYFCPSGQRFSRTRNCVQAVCPAGTTRHAATERCTKKAAACPPGMVVRFGRCSY